MEALWSARRPVRELRPGDHAWLGYESREEQACVVGAFVRAGQAAGDKIISVPGDGRTGSDLAALLTGIKDEIARAVERGHRGVRIAADLSWALGRPGGQAPLARFERDLEAVVGEAALATVLCQFDRHRCTPAELDALYAAHGIVVTADPEFEDEVLRIERTFRPPGLAFTGELDASRHSVLIRALNTARAAAGDRELHLDMSGLGFIDLGALNILADAAGRHDHGHPIVLDRMPPQLRAVMDAVGRHMLPGLELGA